MAKMLPGTAKALDSLTADKWKDAAAKIVDSDQYRKAAGPEAVPGYKGLSLRPK